MGYYFLMGRPAGSPPISTASLELALDTCNSLWKVGRADLVYTPNSLSLELPWVSIRISWCTRRADLLQLLQELRTLCDELEMTVYYQTPRAWKPLPATDFSESYEAFQRGVEAAHRLFGPGPEEGPEPPAEPIGPSHPGWRHLDRELAVLGLPPRCLRVLEQSEIRYVGQLVAMSPLGLLRTRNFGRKCLHEVRQILASLGLSLSMNPTGWKPPP